jgi:hypothetical protein
MAKQDKDRKKDGRKRGDRDDRASGAAAEAGARPSTPGERLQDRSAAGAGGQARGGGGDVGAHEGSGGHGGGGHEVARAHGLPATVDTSLPATREELLARHADARRRRAAAALGSDAFRAAADEIGRIEIRIAAIERDQDPPAV